MWLVKVEMPWHLHEVPYGRRNTLGGIVFEFESNNFHLFKVRSDTSMWFDLDTIKGWRSKRYKHLSYMHNGETKLMHITTLVMVVTRVYYVGRGT